MKVTLLALLVVILIGTSLVSAPPQTTNSIIATAASQMQPGEFREITSQMINLNDSRVPGYFSTKTGEDIWQIDGNTFVSQYTDIAGKWDSVRRILHWDGMAHSGYYRHITYTDNTNRWDLIGDNWVNGLNDSNWYNGVSDPAQGMLAGYANYQKYGVTTAKPTSHSYHNFTIDPVGRYYYHWAAVTPKINRLNLDTGTWDYFPVDVPAFYGQNGVLLWHPGLNAGRGGLVFTPGGTGWAYFNDTTNEWVMFQTLDTGQRSNIGEYSKVAQVALIGGGLPYTIGMDPFKPEYRDPANPAWDAAKVMYRMSADGSLSKAIPMPCPILGTMSINTVDPVTGEFLFACLDQLLVPGPVGTSLWAYNATTNTSRKLFDELPFDPFVLPDPLQGMMATAIDTYGVTLWIKHDGHSSRVWLYKHATGSLPPPVDTIQPTITLTSPPAGEVSGDMVSLAATAFDNVAVVGVQFKIDGVNFGTEDTTSPYTILWNSSSVSNSAHTISATARDAAGNSNISSVSVNVENISTSSTFADKIAGLGPAMIGAYSYDSKLDVRTYPPGEEPLRYTWLREGQGDATHNTFVGPECDQAFAALGETWYPGGLNTTNANAEATPLINPARCNFPVIDTATKFEGAASIKLTVPTKSWAGATGRFKAPMSGMGGTSFIGPGSPLGLVLYGQYLYRLGPTANTFYMLGNTGWKTFIFEGAGALSAVQNMIQDYGDPGCPNGAASCPNGSLPYLAAYGSIGADGWAQDVRGCGYNYNNMHPKYLEPTCFLVHNQTWYEITTRIEIRLSATNATTTGAGSTILNWPNGRFTTGGFTDVYIASGTNFVAGMYHIQSVQSATQVTLDRSPTPAGPGSGGAMFYSYDNNSRFQTWVDGDLIIDFPTAKYAWGPHGAGLGWHNFDLNVYITNKDETQDHPPVDIWYDNVLFATAPIPMKVDSTPPPPVNQAPVISAIPSQTIALPTTTATFTATVTDDGLPTGSKVTYQWSSTPPLVLGSPTALSTTATTSTPGVYTLTFTASDTVLTATRTTTLTVTDTINMPPTVIIRTPTNGQEITAKTFNITIVGADDMGVTWLELFINDRIVRSDALTVISYPWNTSPYKGKSVTIRGVAYDADGKSATTTIMVTVRK